MTSAIARKTGARRYTEKIATIAAGKEIRRPLRSAPEISVAKPGNLTLSNDAPTAVTHAARTPNDTERAVIGKRSLIRVETGRCSHSEVPKSPRAAPAR